MENLNEMLYKIKSNVKDYIVENLKTLRDELPSFYNSL